VIDILLGLILAWCAVWISAKISLGPFFHPMMMFTRIVLGSMAKWFCVGALGAICLSLGWVSSLLVWALSYIGGILIFSFAYHAIVDSVKRYRMMFLKS
jgi:ABC-type Na+ efflux pump permease subunit